MRIEGTKTVGLTANTTATGIANLRQVAAQFEAILLTQLTSALNSQNDGEDGEDKLFGSDGGTDLAKQMFAEQMASNISEAGGVGLADLILQKFQANTAPTNISLSKRDIRQIQGKIKQSLAAGVPNPLLSQSVRNIADFQPASVQSPTPQNSPTSAAVRVKTPDSSKLPTAKLSPSANSAPLEDSRRLPVKKAMREILGESGLAEMNRARMLTVNNDSPFMSPLDEAPEKVVVTDTKKTSSNLEVVSTTELNDDVVVANKNLVDIVKSLKRQVFDRVSRRNAKLSHR